jgi:hypothetical protein
MGHPNDIRKAVRDAAQRIHAAASLIRRLRSQVGDHRDLEPEVDEALRVLTAWAGRVAASTTPEPSPPPRPVTVEPGPLAARPRRRDAWRTRAP